MPVSTEKGKALAARMQELGVSENDLGLSFFLASVLWGQKVHGSTPCVQLVRILTGLSVRCQRERSQTLNRYLARRLLLDKIELQRDGFVAREKEKIEKLRRQKRKRSKRAKEKILAAKHQQAQKKERRGKVVLEE